MLNIHLGAHKTASTHLQHSLRQVRDPLRAAGLFYADPVLLRGMGLSRILSEGPDAPDAQIQAQALAEAAQGWRRDHADLLISEENILGGTRRGNMFSRKGLIYPFAARRLRQVIALAGGGPATVYLAVRDPAAFTVSAFALQVILGNEIDLAPYLRGRDPAQVGWPGLVRRLKAIADVGRVVVWRYEDYAVLRPRLLQMLLPQGMAALVPDPPPSNESLTQRGYEWFLDAAMADSDIDLRVLARRARLRFRRADGHGPLRLLDDGDHARSAAHYADDIAAIRAMPRVSFLDP